MSNLKYKVRFQVTNLDKNELRDFKLSLLESNYILEFDSDVMPRLPNKKEMIRIGDRAFQMEDYEIHYITENEQVFNVFNVFVFDFEKSEKQKRDYEQQKMAEKLKAFSGYRNKNADIDYESLIKTFDVK
jgi:hypothetical protein